MWGGPRSVWRYVSSAVRHLVGRTYDGAVEVKVMVTGAAAPAGATLLTQLRDRRIPVVAVDADHPSSTATGHRVPPVSDPHRLIALRQLGLRENVTVLIPTLREELPQIAAAKSAFDPAVHVVVAGAGPVVIAQDLLYTAWQLQARGVPTPAFGTTADFPDAAAAFGALGGPLVIKSRTGGGRSRVVQGPDQLDWASLRNDDLIQRHVPGAEYLPVVYRPAPRSGVRSLAIAAVRALGVTGPATVQVRRDADGHPQVLKVLARFVASSHLVPELLDVCSPRPVPTRCRRRRVRCELGSPSRTPGPNSA